MKHATREHMILAFAVAALALGPTGLAMAQDSLGPRPGTEDAMKCLTRQGPEGCQQMFVGNASRAAQPWIWQNSNRDFKRGALVSAGYWGRASQTNAFDAKVLVHQTTNQMDIFDVKFAHFEYTFYISPAGPDGKIHDVAIRLYGPHDLNQIRL